MTMPHGHTWLDMPKDGTAAAAAAFALSGSNAEPDEVAAGLELLPDSCLPMLLLPLCLKDGKDPRTPAVLLLLLFGCSEGVPANTPDLLVTAVGCGSALCLADGEGGRKAWGRAGEGWGRLVIDLGRSVVSNLLPGARLPASGDREPC